MLAFGWLRFIAALPSSYHMANFACAILYDTLFYAPGMCCSIGANGEMVRSGPNTDANAILAFLGGPTCVPIRRSI